MILTDEEIRKAAEFAAAQMWPESGYVGWTEDDAVFHRKFMEACLEKLRGGVEMPEADVRIYLIRALYTTPPPAAQEMTSAVPVVEPVAWSHGCNALCANIDLWISSCPHCGKPRPAAPVPQEPT